MSEEYEVILGPRAERLIHILPLPQQHGLVQALRSELADGPNRHLEVTFGATQVEVSFGARSPEGARYTATPLSLGGYTAVHRPMTESELRRLEKERERPVADQGCYVVDILPADTVFTRPH